MSKPFIKEWIYVPYIPDVYTDMVGTFTIEQLNSYANTSEVVRLYDDSPDGGLFIPRNSPYFKDIECSDHTLDGSPRLLDALPIALRPHQGPVIDAFLDAVHSTHPYGGLVLAKPGEGKTVMALEIIRRLGRTAVILVHKTFLLDQWQERISEFLPDASVGIVQQDQCEFGDEYDIVIAMIQSLAARDDYPQAFFDFPGIVVTDEVHRIGAPTWTPVITKFPAKVRLGLTATPRRKDGLEAAFYWHIGPIIAKTPGSVAAKDAGTLDPLIKRVNYSGHASGKYFLYNGRFNWSKWLSDTARLEDRNMLITQYIVAALKKGRKIIALSDRLEQLPLVEKMLKDFIGDQYEIDKYIGGRKKSELAKASKADVILATYKMAAEALDIPDLDVAVFMTPKSDVEQAVGRIQREWEGKPTPVVIDIVDTANKMASGMWYSRVGFYNKINATVR